MDASHKKIIWLASYPKSGNTWFRAFLTALVNDGRININKLRFNAIFSSRTLFENITDFDSRDLYDPEIKILMPHVFRKIAKEAQDTTFVKVHDSFSYNALNQSIIPEDVTSCAIYFIRNPLDIVASLANHMNFSINEAIEFMCEKEACFSSQRNNLNDKAQFRQYLSDWSKHVESWTSLPRFPVYVIRYEDMLSNPFETFKKILSYTNMTYYDDNTIRKAIEETSFEKLKLQEQENGFKEKFNNKTTHFFRKGGKENWHSELTGQQIDLIVRVHHNLMKQYDYLP
jgi:hypothetical protein